MAHEQERPNTQPRASAARDLWFAVVFTAFLAVTFGLYLPLRFQYQQGAEMHDDMNGEMPDMHGAAGEHSDGFALYHESGEIQSGVSVDLAYDLWPPLGHPLFGGTSTVAAFSFYVNEKPGETPVQADRLQVEHAKLMHVIGIRDDLDGFFHIHPEPDEQGTAGLFTASHIFEKPGRYKIWSQIKKDDGVHTFGHPVIEVPGPGEEYRKDVVFDRTVGAGNYRVALTLQEPVAAVRETELVFDIHTRAGAEVEVEPYLDADMHLAIIKDDLTQFIHTHPEGDHMRAEAHAPRLLNEARAHGMEEDMGPENRDQTINFHVTFPAPGLYKAFAQFRPAGTDLPKDEALTAGFWVKAETRAPFQIQLSRGVLAAISLMAIVVLSFFVKRFLAVRV